MPYQNLDSPALLIFKENVVSNIDEMIRIAGDASRLMPHIKTNKMENVVRLMIAKGIRKFKAATIAEAELAAMAGAEKVLISHQLVGPKLLRLKSLIEKYPRTHFATLVDCEVVLNDLDKIFNDNPVSVYIDINNGMDRSGHEVNAGLEDFISKTSKNKGVKLEGLHIYDGHIRDDEFSERKNKIEKAFSEISEILKNVSELNLEIIAGGTPAFTSHALENSRTLSPGTCVLWDWGYGDKFAEQQFKFAATILTRVISKPKKDIVTLDMGHKAVASENPIDKRIRFINNPDLKLISQSEEHGVCQTENWENYKVGQEIIGIPYHVCPTVNLYDEAFVIEKGEYSETWKIEARKRKINI